MEPTATIADVMTAIGGKTSDLVPLSPADRLALRHDLDTEIAAFHREGQDHPVPGIAKKYPLAK